MALAIMISTFGCINGLILAGRGSITRWRATVLFFAAWRRPTGRPRPAVALLAQGLWASLLTLPGTSFD